MKTTINEEDIKDVTFGVEMEFSTPYEDIEPRFKNHFVGGSWHNEDRHHHHMADKCYGASHGHSWDLKLDGSTETEFATPILMLAHREDMHKFENLVKDVFARRVETTDKDSVHVRVYCPWFTNNLVLETVWVYLERKICACFPSHRYKKTGPKYPYNERYLTTAHKSPVWYLNRRNHNKAQGKRDEHNMIISFKDFIYDKRLDENERLVEFRLSEGTSSWEHVYNYAKLCLYFCKACSLMSAEEVLNMVNSEPEHIHKLDKDSWLEIYDTLKLNDEPFKKWLKKRYAKYWKD
ncbi:MAG TPA: hypothetical protein PLA71_00295 [Saccharofermentans sp.]|nr:hypothetical protein [Saccharofermentans sp.]